MRLAVLMVIMWSAKSMAAAPLVSGSVTIATGHHFQGIEQNQDKATVYGSVALHPTERVAAGAWLGQFRLPRYGSATTELDYFVSYAVQPSFGSRLATSIWRYRYLDSALAEYDWTQWLVSYDPDERFTISIGLSHDQFRHHEWSRFIEVTARHDFGFLVGAASIAHNAVTGSPIGSFGYLELKAARRVGAIDVFGTYAKPMHVNPGLADRLVHDGFEFGISYAF